MHVHSKVVTDPTTNLTILSSLLADSPSTDVDEPPSKRSRHVITPAIHVQEQRVASSPFVSSSTPDQISPNPSPDVSQNEILLKRLVKAMTDRQTIDLIYQKLHSP